MSTPIQVRPDATLARERRPALCPAIVPATIGLAVSLAVAADTMLREGINGAAFPLWIAMMASSLLVLAWRAGETISREARGWLIAATLFSLGLLWRDSEPLQALDFLATVTALMAAAASLNSPRAVLLAPRLRHLVYTVLRTLRSIAGDFGALLFRDAAARIDSSRWTTLGRRALYVGLLAGVVTLVFGSLLADADPIFASFVTLPRVDVAAVVRHAVVIAVLTWTIGGWARGALIEKPQSLARIGTPPWPLGGLEIKTVFITLIVLFGAFILTQLGWLFGGEAFLRERTGLTAASYARNGFFQMVWIVVLVIPLIVATRAALRPGWALARQDTQLALPVIALLGAIIVSAALRMRLYVRYYGLSIERFYPLVFMGWLAFVLVWLAVTTLRGRPKRLGSGVVLSALATLVGLNVVSPDRVVARTNIARSAIAGSQPLDVSYLATLSGEAIDWTVPAILADANDSAEPIERCRVLKHVLNRWGPTRQGDWRTWNAGTSHAENVVAAHAAELEVIRRDACQRAEAARQNAKARLPDQRD
jgi:hypothetical protein